MKEKGGAVVARSSGEEEGRKFFIPLFLTCVTTLDVNQCECVVVHGFGYRLFLCFCFVFLCFCFFPAKSANRVKFEVFRLNGVKAGGSLCIPADNCFCIYCANDVP